MMQEIIDLLGELPKPLAAWRAIENELLKESNPDYLAGAIMQTVPVKNRQAALPLIKRLADVIWQMFESTYKTCDGWNNARLGLRSMVSGYLKRPVGRPVDPGSMAKKNKAWSMPAADWEWLELQPNQSEIIRKAISQYRSSLPRP
jgi:hypothetical protein